MKTMIEYVGFVYQWIQNVLCESWPTGKCTIYKITYSSTYITNSEMILNMLKCFITAISLSYKPATSYAWKKKKSESTE